ncbi:uncharacterized protein LOC127705475 [Mytilus californianus]|uniref:uncharacterized protein LOC127705475 n=1 Tax=Mytilus californianus TaxID=6549 RepID=UPI002245DE14|nr:uncharacterized protein LOC127705475 [Mytilus californianus]
MTCIVQSTLDVKLLFYCHNMPTRKSERFNGSTVYVSVDLYIEAKNDDNICTCSSQFENFTTSTSVALQVTNPPVIEIVGKTICNSSSSIELSCSLSGDLDTHGFDPWQHAINEVVVRELIGVISNNTSVLMIPSCSFNDRGDYTCIAWNRKKRKKDYLRKSTSVKVKEPPFIVASYLYNESITLLSVDYLSDAEPNSPRWFRYKTSLVNSTLFTIINTRTTLVSQIHGKEVVLSGFSTNLSLNNKARGEYTVMLSNRYGETEYKFNLISEQSSFLFSSILLVLTGMVVFIVTVGAIGTVIKINSLTGDLEMKCYLKNPGRGAIYYAAPEDENQVHVYNETDTGYEESTESNETGHYMEISDIYEDLENGRDDRHSYEFSHHYIEVKPD